jgi:hypothetical protein
MAIQITGIRKPGGAQNTAEAISHYRWIEDGTGLTDITDRMTVVGWLEDRNVTAYVANGSQKVWCEVRQNQYGTKFLQTIADGRETNNLLSLPEC